MSIDAAATGQHLRHLTGTAVAALLRVLDRTTPDGVDTTVGRHPFLLDYVQDVARAVDDGADWDASLTHYLAELTSFEKAHPGLPLLRLQVLGALHARLVYAFAGLVADDFRFGAIAQMLQVPLAQPAFAPQTIAAALDDPGERRTHYVVEELLTQHLLWTADGDGPAVQVDPTLWHLVCDSDHPGWSAASEHEGALEHWRAQRRQSLLDAVNGLVNGAVDTLVIRSVPGAGAHTALAAAISASASSMVSVDRSALQDGSAAAAATVRGAIPVLDITAAPGSEEPSPRPPWYCGPLVVLMGRSGGLAPNGDRRLHLHLDRGDPQERAAFWRRVRPRPTASPTSLANAFVLPDGHLRRIARDATTRADVDGRSRPRLDDLRIAARSIGEHALETRATAVETDNLRWRDLAVADEIEASIRSLQRRCELREQVAEGQRSRGAVGVRALLLGPSGVGKTLAATVLAAELGRRAYRVDLAAIFDKYVGETEKHIDQVLAAAEQLDCVLIIDEGDTLLGTRTDGSTANDRYANLETNFLLQRLEEYTGIVVVTSNAGDRIDPAFARRMDTTITFPRPRATQRVAIWRLHLPAGHAVDDEALWELAVGNRLTGGQIRNAALYARMLALDDEGQVQGRHVDAAIALEYRKSGRLLPGGRRAVNDGAHRRDDFLAAQRALGERRGSGRG